MEQPMMPPPMMMISAWVVLVMGKGSPWLIVFGGAAIIASTRVRAQPAADLHVPDPLPLPHTPLPLSRFKARERETMPRLEMMTGGDTIAPVGICGPARDLSAYPSKCGGAQNDGCARSCPR